MAELGPGVYGVEAAARRYFGKAAAALEAGRGGAARRGPAEAAPWHPGVKSRAYQVYAGSIMRRMERADFLRRHI